VNSASAEVAGVEADLRAAEIDLQRFEALGPMPARRSNRTTRGEVDVARERSAARAIV
jgi:hypothetical protein